ncbi:MAG: HAD family hydrolase [Candidatus Omnitrophica bacterium]|nr:HAD family hydrolase [Candidatus Omnitrophota bacterium]
MPALADILGRARVLVFDFDGTLVDSNPIKRRAFERCFAEFPEQRQEILAYCWSRDQTPRGEKFQHVVEQILRQPYTEALAAVLHERFEAATTWQIVEAPEIPGAAEFLRKARGRHLLAVLSNTPHEILGRILAQRGWQGWFEVVQGAPVHKASWLKAFCRQRGLEPSHVVFFGDTPEDASAAEEAGCPFIGMGGVTGLSGARAVSDFTHLVGMIPQPAAGGASTMAIECSGTPGWLGAAEAGHKMRGADGAGLGHAERGPRQVVG